MDEFQKQMFDIFVFETNSFLEQLETILMHEESQDGNILEAVPEIFRIMHTIKSSSAMMDLPNISKLAHSVEDLFFFIRENKPATIDKKKLTDIVFACVDYIKRNMAADAEEDPSQTISHVKAYLAQLQQGGAEPSQIQAETSKSDARSASPAPSASSSGASPAVHVTFKPNCAMIGLRAFEIITKVERIQAIVQMTPAEEDPNADALLQSDGLRLTFASAENLPAILKQIEASPFVAAAVAVSAPSPSPRTQAPAPLPQAPVAVPLAASPTSPPSPSAAPDSSPRDANGNFVERRTAPRNDSNYLAIDIKKLDQLINLAGEIIISSMGATHAFAAKDREQTHLALEILHRLILDMQDHALSLRMISVKDMFHKLNRTARDISGKLDKKIEFVMSGEETAVDRNVIDHVFSPLMHILRNSMDHGIEAEGERLAAGKPAAGKVHLSASIEGNQAVLSVTDDGRGIDRSLVLQKAVDSGLVTEEQSHKMSDEDVFALLFLPGFSTKSEVTELSGRGVGMDVVNDSVRKMNGRITISSKVGRGTKMELRIPLTLAILDALIVQIGDETCAIPVSVVKEAFKPSLESIREANGADVVLLRGSCYQIVRLGDIFGIPHTGYDQGLMLILDANGEPYALHISNALEQQSIVVKPIPPLLKGIPGIFGCTILGNGMVCLIIDVVSLWKRAKGRGDHHGE